ncbi:hypothetical protein DPEC_G00370380 [Dallia pectoralis]|nr:hypothetical protein DPEC_G00370380 [Dallia pectoralis]
MAQQTVSKRIKRTPEGIDRTGVQLAGGACFAAIASHHKRSEVATGLPEAFWTQPLPASLSSRGSVKLGCEVLHL